MKKRVKNKRNRKFNFAAWILLIILLTLATLFVIDKYRHRELLTQLSTERDTLAYNCAYFKKQYESRELSYSYLLESYNAIVDSSSSAGSLDTNSQEIKKLQAIIMKQDSIVNSVNKIVKEAFSSFKSDELSVEAKNGKIYIVMQDHLLFQSGRSDVEYKGVEALRELSLVLNNNPNIDIMVEGHTDDRPINTAKFSDNWALSVARANAIVRILTNEYNVYPKRMTAAGRGEYFPIETNETAEGRKKNRRTEIILTPNIEELYKLIETK